MIFEDCLGTEFEVGSGLKIEVVDTTFQAHISRSYSSINWCLYSTDFGYAGTVFEDWNFANILARLSRRFAQNRCSKSTETETVCWSNLWVEISWIFYCKNLMSDFLSWSIIINSLSLTGFPLVGFSRAIGQKSLSRSFYGVIGKCVFQPVSVFTVCLIVQ